MTKIELQSKSKVPLGLAERVVKILREVTGNKVNFMGEGGIVLASAQPERVGTVHEGGKKIMSGRHDEIALTDEMVDTMEDTLKGFIGVIKYRGERVGCIWISGDPEQVRPLQKLAEVIILEELERSADQEDRRDELGSIVENVKDISDRMGILALNGS